MKYSGKNKRPTISDVARLAGVGTATVDRVLNERGNVSESVRKAVIDAAREIGLKRVLPQSYHQLLRINLILPRPELPLLQYMGREFRRIARAAGHNLALHVTTINDEQPVHIAETMLASNCDAIIVYAQDAPEIRDAISELWRRGVPVVTMISDVSCPERLAYAGTDHFAAGRSAGYFLSRMSRRPGSIIVLCNHLGFQSHADRVAGLQSFLSENNTELTVARVVEGHDDRVRSRARLEAAFREVPDTTAVYNVGAANLGVRAAIEKDILPQRPVFIGHELTQHTMKMLRDGVITLVIDQSPKLQAQFAIDVLLDHFGFEDSSAKPPYQSNVPLTLYGPEYIPSTLMESNQTGG